MQVCNAACLFTVSIFALHSEKTFPPANCQMKSCTAVDISLPVNLKTATPGLESCLEKKDILNRLSGAFLLWLFNLERFSSTSLCVVSTAPLNR